MTLNAVASYLHTLEARGASTATCRAARSDLRHLMRRWEERHRQAFDLSLLVERDLRAWKLARQKEDGAAPSTINRGLSTLRAFCTWAVAQGLLAENPATGVPDVPTEPVAPRSLPDEKADTALRARPSMASV